MGHDNVVATGDQRHDARMLCRSTRPPSVYSGRSGSRLISAATIPVSAAGAQHPGGDEHDRGHRHRRVGRTGHVGPTIGEYPGR
jgi:hypothetical protein